MSPSHSSEPIPPSEPPVRRILTGHSPDGKAIILEDARVKPRQFPGSGTYFTDLFWADESPADNGLEYVDKAVGHEKDIVSPGSVFRLVEMPPGAQAPMHRTVSLDYAIIVKGQLTLILDDNKRAVLHPGDVAIQRGTIHSWKNEGTEWVRMYAIVLPAQNVKIGESELQTEFRRPQ